MCKGKVLYTILIVTVLLITKNSLIKLKHSVDRVDKQNITSHKVVA